MVSPGAAQSNAAPIAAARSAMQTILLALAPLRSLRLRARRDLVQNRLRVLEARVLVREEREIGVPRGDRALHRALRRIALPGAAEDYRESTLRRPAKQAEQRLKGDGRMREIHDHREGLPHLDPLQMPRDIGECAEPGGDRLRINPLRVPDRRRRQRIEDVVRAECVEMDGGRCPSASGA